jgi:hypothetical protein
MERGGWGENRLVDPPSALVDSVHAPKFLKIAFSGFSDYVAFACSLTASDSSIVTKISTAGFLVCTTITFYEVLQILC